MATKHITDLLVCQVFRDVKEQKIPDFPVSVLMERSKQCFKVCVRAIERAYDRGYLECGVSLNAAWLTDKGIKLLEELDVVTHKVPKIIRSGLVTALSGVTLGQRIIKPNLLRDNCSFYDIASSRPGELKFAKLEPRILVLGSYQNSEFYLHSSFVLGSITESFWTFLKKNERALEGHSQNDYWIAIPLDSKFEANPNVCYLIREEDDDFIVGIFPLVGNPTMAGIMQAHEMLVPFKLALTVSKPNITWV